MDVNYNLLVVYFIIHSNMILKLIFTMNYQIENIIMDDFSFWVSPLISRL